MKFELNEEQVAKYKTWEKEQGAKGVNKQRADLEAKNIKPDYTHLSCWEMGYPYTGAVGGEHSFIFTPNGIGECVKVKNSVTGDELDLTDFDSW